LQEDDDEEDGARRPMNGRKSSKKNGHAHANNDLSFNDSDEDKEGSELITLDESSNGSRDRTNTAAEKVPKLKKPSNV